MATTAALSLKFFPSCSPMTAYKRLWRMEKGEAITSIWDPKINGFIWMLTLTGFALEPISKMGSKQKEVQYLESMIKELNPGHSS